MAKTNMVEREKRRAKIVKKYAAKRAQLKELIRSPKTNPEVRADAQRSCRSCRATQAPPAVATVARLRAAHAACIAASAWRA